MFRYSDKCSFVCMETKTCRYALDRRNQQEITLFFLVRSVWNSQKDAITGQNVSTLVILGLHRKRMHIRPKLPCSTYRAVSDVDYLNCIDYVDCDSDGLDFGKSLQFGFEED